MSADIDVRVSGSSPIGFTPSYPFKPDVRTYNPSSDVLKADPSTPSYGPRRNSLDFPTALSSGPNSGSYLTHYSSAHYTFHGRCSSLSLRTTVPSPTPNPSPQAPPTITLAKNLSHLRLNPAGDRQMPVAVPRRPCLVVRCDVLDIPSPNRSKKRVVFADDRGYPLTLVRTITEPTNMPPQLSFHFFAEIAERTNSGSPGGAEPWELAFPQPASDYLDFRRRLDTNNVSLENVILKEGEQVIVGTVKVRNLVFHKEVFVRTTADRWKTQEDTFCTYVPNSPPGHGVKVLYDTFAFRLPLPAKSRKLEFCVCFRSSAGEYWDNNSGKNYSIAKKDAPVQARWYSQARSDTFEADRFINLPRQFSDDLKPNTQLESWSEFASWNHLNNNTPYW